MELDSLSYLIKDPSWKNAETWISLPKHQQPSSWSKFKDPVCRLRLNLYGHPLAGLYWEKHCEKVILEAGFEKVTGWECLYVHRSEQLFLSVYVDDFKLAGNKANIPKMWRKLKEKLDLEPPTPFHDSVYLGCGQEDFHPTENAVAAQWTAFADIFRSADKTSVASSVEGRKLLDTEARG